MSHLTMRRGKIKTAERDVAAACVQWLRLKGWHVYRQQSGTVRGVTGGFIRLSENGRPDYLCLRPQQPGNAEMFWLETKSTGGVLRPAQRIWHEEAAHQNQLVCVASSLAELQQWYETEDFG